MEEEEHTFLLIIRAAGYHDAGLVRSVRWSMMSPLLLTAGSSNSSARGEAPAHTKRAHAVISEAAPYLMQGALARLTTDILDISLLGVINANALQYTIGLHRAGITWKGGK